MLASPQRKIEFAFIALDSAGNVHTFDLQRNMSFKNTFKTYRDVWRRFTLPSQTTIARTSGKKIKLYDLSSGKCIKKLQGHTGYVCSVTMLPDGMLASGSSDGIIKIWNLQSGLCIRTLHGHTSEVCSLVAFPDATLVSGASDAIIKLWNTVSGECIRTLTEHTKTVTNLVVLSNGTLASSSYDATIKIWDRGNCLKTLSTWPNHVDIEGIAALSPHKFISYNSDGDIYFTHNSHIQKIYSRPIGSLRSDVSITALEDGSFISTRNTNMRLWKSTPDLGVSCEKISPQI